MFEFLAIMRSAPILPLLLRPVQHLMVRAAIDLTPRWLRTILGLNGHGLHVGRELVYIGLEEITMHRDMLDRVERKLLGVLMKRPSTP